MLGDLTLTHTLTVGVCVYVWFIVGIPRTFIQDNKFNAVICFHVSTEAISECHANCVTAADEVGFSMKLTRSPCAGVGFLQVL